MNDKFSSVWDALEDSPEESEAMKIKSNFMIAIQRCVENMNTTQTEAANKLGITQPRLNDLLKGKIEKFSIDSLVAITVRSGQHIEMKFSEVS